MIKALIECQRLDRQPPAAPAARPSPVSGPDCSPNGYDLTVRDRAGLKRRLTGTRTTADNGQRAGGERGGERGGAMQYDCVVVNVASRETDESVLVSGDRLDYAYY